MIKRNHIFLGVIIFLAFFVRIFNLSYPAFTADEARIAYRGYTLATLGKDELGRSFPLLFNSLSDYQLPIVSYLAALGEFIFGKSDLGARIPFIFFGTLIVLLIYKFAGVLFFDPRIKLLSALIVTFSPPLIFLSRTPNEVIVLCFLLMLAFYSILCHKNNFKFVFILGILAVLTSKAAWFIFPPAVLLTLLFRSNNIFTRRNIILIMMTSLISVLAFLIFAQIPQGQRSLLGNNFSIFNDVTIVNGINRLGGQGVESGWPQLLIRVLFNKFLYAYVGIVHWLSHLQPAFYFGQLDETGRINFPGMGVFANILIIPFLSGLISVFQSSARRYFLLLIFLPLLTVPAIFVYPGYSLHLVVLTVPFMGLIIALGLEKFSPMFRNAFIFLAVFEIILQFVYPLPSIKAANPLRPAWIEPIMIAVAEAAVNEKVIMSDDITNDNVSFLEWYTDFDPRDGFADEKYPYRLRQGLAGNIVMHGFDKDANLCNKKDRTLILASKRDITLIEDEVDLMSMFSYKDSLNQEKVFSLTSKLCIE